MKKRMKRHLFPIIEKTIQYRFVAITLVYSAVIIILLALPMFVPDFIALGDEQLTPDLRGAVATRILTLHARVWPPVVLVIFMLSLYSFRIVHRIVGPLIRFRWAFKKVKEGELNFRVRIRSKDYLNNEAGVFNEMMEALVEKLGGIQSSSLEATKSLDELEKLAAEKFGEQEEFKRVLQEHHQHLENLVNQVRYFQLGTEEKPE